MKEDKEGRREDGSSRNLLSSSICWVMVGRDQVFDILDR